MSRFALKYPYFIVVICLMICVIGVSSIVRMPVDLFPSIKIPVVVVATFYSGMPPEQIENDITGRFERFFTLGSGIEHIESRSLPGVSLIKVYFQPGTNADSAVTTISNLAMAQLRRLPPGTLPPVVLKFVKALPVITTFRLLWPCTPAVGDTESSAGVDPVTVKLLANVSISPPVDTVTFCGPTEALLSATSAVAVVAEVT